jgi:tRNA nucleotidyltransferase (CCA-adding enzyme)
MVLEAAARLSASPRLRFAALTHDLGKGTTPPAEWPKHVGHEERSVTLVHALGDRLKVPTDFRELAVLVARYHGLCHRALELRASTVLELLEHADALRRPERFEEFLLACEADMRGRAGFAAHDYPQAEFLRAARAAAQQVALPEAELATLAGAAIGARLRALRLDALAALCRARPPTAQR